MPTEFSSTPAWDPGHSGDDPETTAQCSTPKENISSSGEQAFRHVLLNPALAGKNVKATINDGSGKVRDAVVSLHCSNGDCSIRTLQYHTSVQVPENTVEPKHPSPTHDNGLVMVIKGAHAGKYGRRLYHSRNNGLLSMILEVVIVQDGHKDILTGDILELTADYLCTVDESPKQKKLNGDVMKESRQRYREQMKH